MKANSTLQEERQNADSKDGAKCKGKNDENHLPSFRNYAVEPKFDVQPQINIRKSKEEIAFEQDVGNLFTKEDEENLFIEEDVDNLLPEQEVDNLFKKDVDNLLTEQQVKPESSATLISKAKNEKDSFDGEGVFNLPG